MSAHSVHTMHGNSLSAHADLDTAERKRRIVGALALLHAATDRQIAEWLGVGDMNAVRPRVTELIKAGTLREIGSQPDHVTGRKVRIVEVAQ